MIAMRPSKLSREHKQRVLENQLKLAAERTVTDQVVDPVQLNMPMLVEVTLNHGAKRPARRSRRKPQNDQIEFSEI